MMILITGAGGRVGRGLEAGLQARFPDRVVAATREEIDLTDPARVALELERLSPPPTVAINCSAMTDPLGAESSPQACLDVNRDGVLSLARACREIGCRFIHLSTVDVFSGRSSAPYREEQTPDPLSAYAKTRYLGEIAARENPDQLILRMSMLCGDGQEGDPLVRLVDAAGRGEPLDWEDRRVTPMWMPDLVAALATILRSNWRGILHLGNGGSCILSDFVSEAMRVLEAGRAPELRGGTGPASFWEGSGPNGALDCSKFAQLSGRRLRDWRDALSASFENAGTS
jgi:dTDP-4-dehydrorhamnose reductase